VIKFAGSIEDAQLEIEMQSPMRTFDALFQHHRARLRHIRQQAQKIVAARLRYLQRQAAATVRAMFIADREQRTWPGSDAAELVKSLGVTTILARAKAYADAVAPRPAWWKTTNALC
jgi:hypothetical protein